MLILWFVNLVLRRFRAMFPDWHDCFIQIFIVKCRNIIVIKFTVEANFSICVFMRRFKIFTLLLLKAQDCSDQKFLKQCFIVGGFWKLIAAVCWNLLSVYQYLLFIVYCGNVVIWVSLADINFVLVLPWAL